MNATAYLACSLAHPSREQRRELLAAAAAQAFAKDATGFRGGMHTPVAQHALAKDQLLVMSKTHATLLCLDGMLWLTREGDIEDYILGPGQSFTARRHDKVTVQALRPSRLRLSADPV
jgi:hypothetical protein